MNHNSTEQPVARRLQIVSSNPAPLRLEQVRVMAKFRMRTLSRSTMPSTDDINGFFQNRLDGLLERHLLQHNVCDALRVTQVLAADVNAPLHQAVVMGYTYLKEAFRIHEDTPLAPLLDKAHDKLANMERWLPTCSDWKIEVMKHYLAPLEGKGFPAWLHNKIVVENAASTLRL